MKSWTALNINEFTLFDMFGSPCRRVVMFSKFAGSLNMRTRCLCLLLTVLERGEERGWGWRCVKVFKFSWLFPFVVVVVRGFVNAVHLLMMTEDAKLD